MSNKSKRNHNSLWVIVLVLILICCAALLARATQNQVILLVIMALCVIGIVLLVSKKKPAAQKKPQQTTSTREENLAAARARVDDERAARAERAIGGSITTTGRRHVYKLRGVTFEGRQNWLAKISEAESPFAFPSYELEPYTWKGSPACRVLALPDDGSDPVDIGNIPAESARDVCSLIDRVTSVDVEVYGGPSWDEDTKSYGAEVTITIR